MEEGKNRKRGRSESTSDDTRVKTSRKALYRIRYCLNCRTYTDTKDVKRSVFTAESGVERRYDRGRCTVCYSIKALL